MALITFLRPKVTNESKFTVLPDEDLKDCVTLRYFFKAIIHVKSAIYNFNSS